MKHLKSKILVLCGSFFLLAACVRPLSPVWPGTNNEFSSTTVITPLSSEQWGSAPMGRQPVVQGSFGGGLTASTPPVLPFSDEKEVSNTTEVPVPKTPAPEIPVSKTPVSKTPVSKTPVPETPVPETPKSTVKQLSVPDASEVVSSLEVKSSEDIDSEYPVEDWLAQEGMDLKVLMQSWGDRAGWRIVWETDRKYVLKAGAMFHGRFIDVTSALVKAFKRAKPVPYAIFYKGNRVVVVKTLGHENAD